jgi:ryanodine receptor 2
MNRNMTFWYNKDEPVFIDVVEDSHVEVIRIPPGSDSPPALKISHKLFETQEKASWEFLRLSLPVACNEDLIDELEKSTRWEEVKRRMRRNKTERVGFMHSAKLEQHMLQSGIKLLNIISLQFQLIDSFFSIRNNL